MESFSFPPAVKEIEKNILKGCTQLTSVAIPETVTDIDSGAFAGCKKLEQIDLPNDLAYIGKDIVARTAYASSKEHWDSGLLYIGKYLVQANPKKLPEHLDIRPDTTLIASYLLKDYQNPISLSIPESVETIGVCAFHNCAGLNSVIIPKGVKRIGADAFSINSNPLFIENLSKVPLLFSLASYKEVGGYKGSSFYSTDLNSLNFEATCARISGYLPNEQLDHLGQYNKKIAVMCYLGSRDRYSTEEQKKYDAFIKKNSLRLLKQFAQEGNSFTCRKLLETGLYKPSVVMELTEKLDDIEVLAVFLDYLHKNINIEKEQNKAIKREITALERGPESAEMLRKLWSTDKFADETLRISSVKGTEEHHLEVPAKIGKSTVTVIGSKAFSPWVIPCRNEDYRRNGIFSVVLSDGIKLIQEKAFYGCEALEEITLPKDLIMIENMAFSGCSRLKEIVLPEEMKWIDWGAFSGCSNLARIIIPAGVYFIGHGAFNNCPNVTIYAPTGSYAEKYAKENDIPFKDI